MRAWHTDKPSHYIGIQIVHLFIQMIECFSNTNTSRKTASERAACPVRKEGGCVNLHPSLALRAEEAGRLRDDNQT